MRLGFRVAPLPRDSREVRSHRSSSSSSSLGFSSLDPSSSLQDSLEPSSSLSSSSLDLFPHSFGASSPFSSSFSSRRREGDLSISSSSSYHLYQNRTSVLHSSSTTSLGVWNLHENTLLPPRRRGRSSSSFSSLYPPTLTKIDVLHRRLPLETSASSSFFRKNSREGEGYTDSSRVRSLSSSIGNTPSLSKKDLSYRCYSHHHHHSHHWSHPYRRTTLVSFLSSRSVKRYKLSSSFSSSSSSLSVAEVPSSSSSFPHLSSASLHPSPHVAGDTSSCDSQICSSSSSSLSPLPPTSSSSSSSLSRQTLKMNSVEKQTRCHHHSSSPLENSANNTNTSNPNYRTPPPPPLHHHLHSNDVSTATTSFSDKKTSHLLHYHHYQQHQYLHGSNSQGSFSSSSSSSAGGGVVVVGPAVGLCSPPPVNTASSSSSSSSCAGGVYVQPACNRGTGEAGGVIGIEGKPEADLASSSSSTPCDYRHHHHHHHLLQQQYSTNRIYHPPSTDPARDRNLCNGSSCCRCCVNSLTTKTSSTATRGSTSEEAIVSSDGFSSPVSLSPSSSSSSASITQHYTSQHLSHTHSSSVHHQHSLHPRHSLVNERVYEDASCGGGASASSSCLQKLLHQEPSAYTRSTSAQTHPYTSNGSRGHHQHSHHTHSNVGGGYLASTSTHNTSSVRHHLDSSSSSSPAVPAGAVHCTTNSSSHPAYHCPPSTTGAPTSVLAPPHHPRGVSSSSSSFPPSSSYQHHSPSQDVMHSATLSSHSAIPSSSSSSSSSSSQHPQLHQGSCCHSSSSTGMVMSSNASSSGPNSTGSGNHHPHHVTTLSSNPPGTNHHAPTGPGSAAHMYHHHESSSSSIAGAGSSTSSSPPPPPPPPPSQHSSSSAHHSSHYSSNPGSSSNNPNNTSSSSGVGHLHEMNSSTHNTNNPSAGQGGDGGAAGGGGGGAQPQQQAHAGAQQRGKSHHGTSSQHGSNNHHSNKPTASMPRPHSDWQIPDRYEIRHLIGTGSYGHVCEAYDKVEKRVVAIKKIHRVFEDLIDCKRILREISILNRLNHDHVVKVLDIIIPKDVEKFDELYVVLEIADSDFKKLFRTPVYLTELHIKTLLYNLLVGVKYVHSAGILHRDLKPANCLVNQDCSVKVCDFGLARTVDYAEGGNSQLPISPREDDMNLVTVPHTKNLKRQLTGHVVTRWYRAPELILLQENYTEAIDVWSVGCIFAELLNMVKENVAYHADRGPLFPGSSCFPLSPDQKAGNDFKFHTRGNRDQLNVIFNILGTPSDEDVEALEKEDAKRYIRIFPKRDKTDLSERFPASSPEALHLLKRMLVFNPNKRITIKECLSHPFFKDVRITEVETNATEKVRLPFNDWMNMDEPQLRYAFVKEIQRFHPETPLPRGKSQNSSS